MKILCICALVACYPCALPLSADRRIVEERNGNVYLVESNGVAAQVTDSGKDRFPALSPDGSRIVFVRDLSGDPDYSDVSRTQPASRKMQVWIVQTADIRSPKLVLDSPIEVKGRQFSGFYSPQLSSDDADVYFLIQFGASSGAIVQLNIPTKKLTYITDALNFAVVPSGRYKDALVVQQHRAKLAAGYYDWFYLLKPTGEEIGVIGQGKDDVYNFADTYIGEASLCKVWNSPAWMTCVSQGN